MLNGADLSENMESKLQEHTSFFTKTMKRRKMMNNILHWVTEASGAGAGQEVMSWIWLFIYDTDLISGHKTSTWTLKLLSCSQGRPENNLITHQPSQQGAKWREAVFKDQNLVTTLLFFLLLFFCYLKSSFPGSIVCPFTTICVWGKSLWHSKTKASAQWM